jgi:hypothetical protein
MTNICYTSDLYVQDIKKQLNSKVRPEYIFLGRHKEAQAGI